LGPLTGCLAKETAVPVSPVTSTVEPAQTITTEKPGLTHLPPEETAIPASYPDLVAVRHGEPEDMVRRAVAALGGMERFVPPGSTVVIKPNICFAYHTYEYAATTNPWVVGTLVNLCYEAGAARVKVMDNPSVAALKRHTRKAASVMLSRLPVGRWCKWFTENLPVRKFPLQPA